jgi:tRNA(Ile)-lysidine synthase
VERLAAKFALPIESGSGDVRRLARDQKLSVEAAARHARYSFLASAAKKHRIKSVLLAHHADDQVETCLFHFLRGSGAAGLAGMRPHSRRTIDGVTLEIHRPLLSISKQQLLDHLKEHKIRYREDSSNSIADASRNKLRLKLLPLIEELFGSSFRGTIVRNARIFADEEEFLAGEALPFVPTGSKVQGSSDTKTDSPELSVKILRQLHPALRRRVVHSWLKNCGILEPGFAEVERVTSLMDHDEKGKGHSKINLPGNLHARRRGGVIFIEC